MNPKNFDRQARKAELRVVAEAKGAITAIADELAAELVDRAWDRSEPGGSPVASGRYAGSMRVSLNSIDRSTEPEDGAYVYPSPDVHKYNADNLPPRTIRNVARSRISVLWRQFKLGDTIWFSNSVPYARKIESNGHSWQTREGVFVVTVRTVAAKFEGIKLRGLRRG